MRRWIRLLIITSLAIVLFAATAIAQTGLEGRDYRFPGSQVKKADPDELPPQRKYPTIACNSLEIADFLLELEVTSDGTWYFLTGTFTNISGRLSSLTFVHGSGRPGFRISSDGKELYVSHRTAEAAFMPYIKDFERGEAFVIDATWKGQDKQGYTVEAGPVFIEFMHGLRGNSDNVLACSNVPLLPAGTAWLPSELQGRVSVDSWEVAVLSTLLEDGLLPGYPVDYFTYRERAGREIALAAQLLLEEQVVEVMDENQYRLACDLADAVGI